MLLEAQHLARIEQYKPVIKIGNSLVEAAVAIVLRNGANGTEFLMMQRAQHPSDPWSGQMSFPGGKLEISDSNKVATAIRETKEELGFDLFERDYLGQLDDVYGMKANRGLSVHVSCFVFKINREVELQGNHEVADSLWLPMSYLNNVKNAYEYYHPKDTTLQMPAVLINQDKGQVLWGLSLRMLEILYKVIGSPMQIKNDWGQFIDESE